MNSMIRRVSCALGLAFAFAGAAMVTGCSDVGDTLPNGEDDASGEDAVVPDSTASAADGTASEDSSVEPDGATPPSSDSSAADVAAQDVVTTIEDATGTSPVDAPSAEPEASVDTGVGTTGSEDAQADSTTGTGIVEAGIDSTVEETGTGAEASVADAGIDSTVEDSGTEVEASVDAAAEASPVDAGHDAAAEAAATEAGGGGTASVPCTAVGQANCVQCSENTNGVCDATSAVIVQRDIELGLVTGGVLNSSGTNECIDSTKKNYVSFDCDDLIAVPSGLSQMANIQGCLDVLNCVMGSPQAGTPGLGGTPATLGDSCANDMSDSVANCYCGTQEPDTNDCSSSPATVAQNVTTGGAGVESPNGVCANAILAGFGLTTSASNGTVITDLGNTALGPGQAAQILQCGGSDESVGAQECPQCFNP